MKKLIFPAVLIAAAFLGGASVMARVSPHETVSAVIDGNTVTITYGRPYTTKPGTTKARKIWGGLVPYGKVWRTGADEATVFKTEKDLEMGGTTIPAGTYTLWTVPEEDGGKLVICKEVGQWGTEYKEGNDLARVDLKREPLQPAVHQFTIAISKAPGGGGQIKLQWEDVQYVEPFTVKK